jgi:hypothetical protein
VDAPATIPELAAFSRVTTRLHPRRGKPSVDTSSIGGPLRWPADEPWPVCTTPHRQSRTQPVDEWIGKGYPDAIRARLRGERLTAEQTAILDHPLIKDRHVVVGGIGDRWEVSWSEAAGHEPPNPLAALAQLYAADVPTIPFPEGKDLLQVLWCPADHEDIPGQRHYFGPPVHLFWRRAEEIGDVLTDPPKPHTVDDRFYLSKACVLHPEQVTEHQYADLLPSGLREQVEAMDEGDWQELYQSDLSIAPGCKAGGWASWHLTDPWHETCSTCGADFDLLVSFHSCEWDGGTISWKAVEDATDDEAQEPTGLTHGRWGAMRIFVCSADVSHPFRLNIQ